MFTRPLLAFLSLAFLVGSSCLQVQSKDPAKERLTNALLAFRNENSLTQEQLDKMLFDYTTKKVPLINKGAVADGVFIGLRSDSNQVFVNNKRWTGANKKYVQVILTDGKTVFTEKETVDEDKLKVVIFSPTKVQVVDFSNHAGFTMSR